MDRQQLITLRVHASKMRRSKIPVTALSESTQVDDTGLVTRTMDLCQHCTGACCQTLRVPVTRDDARRLARHLEITTRSLPLLTIPDAEQHDDEDVVGYLSDGPERPCPYFKSGCSVHPARPEACRGFGLHSCIAFGTFTPLRPIRRK